MALSEIDDLAHRALPAGPDASEAAGVVLRRLPYPYRAALAICSDLDETPDRHVYREIMRFLNTTETTAMGPGVGLEVGNTIYFDMPPGQFAYWNTDDAGRAMVRDLVHSGHVDCLHSYGDLATSRADAGRALDELARHDCRIQVWIDHGTAVTNFGADIMQGHGDELGHAAYHADLTCGFGVRYVWRGRVSSIIAQDAAPALRDVWCHRRPLASARTIAKELAKRALARIGSPKYAMHRHNRVYRRASLRDGTRVYEFMRSNPHCAGVSSCDTGRDIGQVLTQRMLERLVRRGGVCILYTHLGKVRDPRVPFDAPAVAAFRGLAAEAHSGRILVTTTRRLLVHCRAVREVFWTGAVDGRHARINLWTRIDGRKLNLNASDFDGLTFYVPDPRHTRVTIDGRLVETLRRNPPDQTGRPSVSIPWPRLTFPDL